MGACWDEAGHAGYWSIIPMEHMDIANMAHGTQRHCESLTQKYLFYRYTSFPSEAIQEEIKIMKGLLFNVFSTSNIVNVIEGTFKHD